MPKQHTENLYAVSDELLCEVYKTVKKIADALKEIYHCDGISTMQNNEPAGNQEVWHFHIHVFPRYYNDRLYENYDISRWVSHEERMEFVRKLKPYFSKQL